MNTRYTSKLVEKLAKTCKTKGEFKKKYPSAVRAARRMGIYEKICAHMVSGMGIWTKESATKEASRYNNRWDFQKKSKGAYLYLFSNGFLDEACTHMPKNLSVLYEDKEAIRKLALTCASRTEFKTKFQGAYVRACREDYIDEICSHMDELCHDWSDEELFTIAKEYETRLEFRNGNNNAYNACVRRGILNKVCTYMKRNQTVSSYEKELFESVECFFNSVHTLKIRGKIIADKPWIGGFDIDIFIPELNLGIEFDGKYHHSFEGLERGHPKWPKKEIKNYHNIKDDYFLKIKGIQILHIKEIDWKKDKQDCIQKCLEFLGAEQKKAA